LFSNRCAAGADEELNSCPTAPELLLPGQLVVDGCHRLRPKLMTVAVVLASLVPILRETGIGSDVMKPIAAPIVGGMITSTIHVLILVPVFFAMIKGRAIQRGADTETPSKGAAGETLREQPQ
jgi:Cu(I)/Ag(I) efflux system membrane protein CusA/SilA